jgi:hypothetical protein
MYDLYSSTLHIKLSSVEMATEPKI